MEELERELASVSDENEKYCFSNSLFRELSDDVGLSWDEGKKVIIQLKKKMFEMFSLTCVNYTREMKIYKFVIVAKSMSTVGDDDADKSDNKSQI